MSENTLQTLLHQASNCYREGHFEGCIAILNDCLLLAPHPAILANRALAHHKLQLHAEAISDLQQCLRLDHLNYLAHYNLFSLSLKAEHPTAAFQHLCCALSSALTFRCKQTRQMAAAERAIYYASNNKQAILLKGLLHLEKQQHEPCLEMLNQALAYQANPVNQAQIMAVARRVKVKAGMEVTEQNSKYISGRQFQLQTTLSPPSSQYYPSTMKAMVSEFNQLLFQLTKSIETSKMVSMTSSGSLGSSLLQHSISSIKQERASNCITTAHNSTLNNQSECNTSDQSLTRASYTLFMERQSANWLIASSYNSVIPEQSSSVVDNWSSSIASSSKPSSQLDHKGVYLNFTVKEINIQKQIQEQNRELYSLLSYNSKENKLFRSSLARSHSRIIPLNDTSEEFKLSTQPSKVNVRVFKKIFTRFEDQLVGEGEALIETLGNSTLPLYLNGKQTGRVQLLTVLVQ